MLARRPSPTTEGFEGTKSDLYGRSAIDHIAPKFGDSGARRSAGASEFAQGSGLAAPLSATMDVRARGITVPSFILRAAGVCRGDPVLGVAVAVAAVAVATAIQWLARDLCQGTPFLTIYPAVVLTAFIGGYRPGLLSAVLGGLSQWFLFIPEYRFLGLLTYAFDAGLCVLLIEFINRSLEMETQAKERQRLLKDELCHRMQNLFAVIQSVIRFGLPTSDTPVSRDMIEERLFGRLQAMFDANRYVADSAGNVALLDLIRGQIRGISNQFVLHGRSRLMLDPQLTQNFSLVMYELVTNSLKYGALSASDGRVYIDLKETPDAVAFDWVEVGGPTVVAPSDDGSGDGFGSRILGAFARSFCADVTISYKPSGFRYGLRIPRRQHVQA